MSAVQSLTGLFRRIYRSARELGPTFGAGADPNRWPILAFAVPIEHRNGFKLAYPEFQPTFVSRNETQGNVLRLVERMGHHVVICWGAAIPPSLAAARLARPDIRIIYASTGPFRLPTTESMFSSYVVDWSGLYFNSRLVSDFEFLANSFPFSKYKPLLEASARLRAQCFENSEPRDDQPVLVVLQDRTDSAFALANVRGLTHAELITMAAEENPESIIAVRAQTPAVHELRMLEEARDSLPAALQSRLQFVTDERSAFLLACRCRRLYTYNAALGAAAVLAGRPVVTTAASFYSGWGLTEDRALVLRRRRSLSLDEFSALAFALYWRWVSDRGDMLFPAPATDA